MTDPTYLEYITDNLEAVADSTECACIDCYKTFKPEQIIRWKYKTACCPFCYVNMVVPNSLVRYTMENLRDWHQEHFFINKKN